MDLTRRSFVALAAGTAAVAWSPRRVRAAGDVIPPLPEGAFTVAVIPDTQQYKGVGTKSEPKSTDPLTNAIFHAQTRWIADNIAAQRIAFVSHVGDIVDKNNAEQWALARQCMDTLHGVVPYGISVGNHDMKGGDGNNAGFQKVFPASHFKDMPWYGGNLENNTCSFQLFEAGGLECVWVHLPCNAPDKMLDWANGVIGDHPGRLAMVTTHMVLGPIQKPKVDSEFFTNPKGRMAWTKCYGKAGNSGVAMWDKCFSRHANLVAVFCGDQSRSQAMHASTPAAAGNIVHEVLSDYGPGELRLVRFVPAARRIDVVTYNPVTQTLCRGTKVVPAEAEHQFTLAADLRIAAKPAG